MSGPYGIPTRTRRALAARFTVPNLCLNRVRRWIGVGARYPSAATAWANAKHRHPKDHHPPEGVPVFWTGGRFGHVAYSLGGGKVRSTDWPSRGRVGTVTIAQLTRAWGKTYAGWSEDLNGVRVYTPPRHG